MDADARSFKGNVVDDNAIIRINIKWLIQLLVVVSAAVYGYISIEMRIRSLELSLTDANTKIIELVNKHVATEELRMQSLEEELQWYQKEVNLNPLSWKKRKKKK